MPTHESEITKRNHQDAKRMDDAAPKIEEPLPDDPVPAPPVIESGLNARRAFALLLAYVLGQLLIGIVVLLAFAIYYQLHSSIGPAQLVKRLQTPLVLLSAGTLGVLGAALLVAYMTRRFFIGTPKSDAYRLLGLSRASPRNFLGAAVLGLSLALLYVVVATRLVPPGRGHPIGPLAQAAVGGGLPRVLWAILAVVIAPPTEEFLFRGALYTGFERTWGQATAIMLVTVTFVLLHAFEVRYFWPALVAIAILAVTLMLIRLHTDSLGPAIMLHAYYNLGLVIMVVLFTGMT